MGISSLLGLIAGVVVPPSCASCALPGAAVCARCVAALPPMAEPTCAGCGHPLAVPAPRCAHCRGRVRDARSSVRYEGPAPAIVIALKEQRRTVLAGVMAEVMEARLDPPPEDAVLVPVPLAPARELERGFNQSALIAEELGRRWSRPVHPVLVRRDDRARQRGAAPATRATQVKGAFRAASRRRTAHRVCLIDDVHTTGATLAAAAQALWLAGSREISARCFARAAARG